MVLFLIGLGLYDHKDITLRGLEAVKTCSKVRLSSSPPLPCELPTPAAACAEPGRRRQVYLEMYTSILMCGTEKLVRLHPHIARAAIRGATRRRPPPALTTPGCMHATYGALAHSQHVSDAGATPSEGTCGTHQRRALPRRKSCTAARWR